MSVDAAVTARQSGGDAACAPVMGGDRLVTLDFIRGVAVLGILFANILAFGHSKLAYSWPLVMPGHGEGADHAIWLAQYLVIDGKMRGLFTLLFGAGMAMFMDRAWARGETSWLQVRRLGWLLLFGLVHFYLLFWGDILFLYALAGLATLPMVRGDAKALLYMGLAWYVGASLLLIASFTGTLSLELEPAMRAAQPQAWDAISQAWEARLAAFDAQNAAFAQGSYWAELRYTFSDLSWLLGQYPYVAVFETIPLMLIGIALYRFGLFSGGIDRARLRLWGWGGVVLGTALSLPLGLWAMQTGFPPWLTDFAVNAGGQLLRLPVILGLAALLALWAPRGDIVAEGLGGWLSERLVAAGRMAFSNYIGTSLVMLLLFRNWAGRLYGDLDRAELMAAVILGCALMLGWSKPWLKKYRYGPLEWAWRCLTYWKFFPFKR